MGREHSLSLDRVQQSYAEKGFAFPYRALPAAEALEYRARLERMLAEDPACADYLRGLPHLVFPLVDRLVRDDRILDAAAAVLGPDLLLWGSAFFPKAPHTSDFVSWHQDLTYWGLDGTDEVTVWLALSQATVENGCMRFIPGSHHGGIQAHDDTFATENSLTRGQQLAVAIDEAKAVHVTLAPGEVSLHDGRMFHASGPNRTDRWRLGLAIQYLKPSMRQIVARADYAQLVRGQDRFAHFKPLPRPVRDYDPQGIAARAQVMRAQSEALYASSARRPQEGGYYIEQSHSG